jgi:transposase
MSEAFSSANREPSGSLRIASSQRLGREHFNFKAAGLGRTNVMFRRHDGANKSAQIVEFLKALRKRLWRKLPIIRDGAAQHKSRIVKAYLESTRGAVQMALLPGYAPDLNPVESLWAWLERHALANFCPDTPTKERGRQKSRPAPVAQPGIPQPKGSAGSTTRVESIVTQARPVIVGTIRPLMSVVW